MTGSCNPKLKSVLCAAELMKLLRESEASETRSKGIRPSEASGISSDDLALLVVSEILKMSEEEQMGVEALYRLGRGPVKYFLVAKEAAVNDPILTGFSREDRAKSLVCNSDFPDSLLTGQAEYEKEERRNRNADVGYPVGKIQNAVRDLISGDGDLRERIQRNTDIAFIHHSKLCGIEEEREIVFRSLSSVKGGDYSKVTDEEFVDVADAILSIYRKLVLQGAIYD